MMSETVWAAARKSLYGTRRSMRSGGSGRRRTMISVTMPRVPSEPVRSWIRSYPVTSFMSLPPRLTRSPEGSTASSPQT